MKWIVLATGLFVAALVVEAGLRMTTLVAPPPERPKPMRPELNRADPELGYTLKPHLQTTFRYPPTSTRDLQLVANGDGFRNSREFDEPDSRPRLWVLGDSMTFGEGVNVEQRLTEVVGGLEPGWRVDNLGMTGWGLDSMVRAYERIAARVRPKVVLLDFYTDDFRRLRPYYSGMGYPSLKFELDGENLIDVPFPEPPTLWRQLRIVQAVEQTYWRFRRDRLELNAALLQRLRKDTAPDVTLAVAFLPGTGDTDVDKTRRAFLNDWCRDNHVPFVDLTEPILRLGAPGFIPGNPHWNERGHEVAGRALHQFLVNAKVMQ